jgi:hypothetical protein
MMMRLMGGISFFPINIEDRYSCIYDFYTNQSHDGMMVIDNSEVFDKTRPDQEKIGAISVRDRRILEYIQSRLLVDYIVTYGILWWFSLGLLIIFIYLLKMGQAVKNQNSMSSEIR